MRSSFVSTRLEKLSSTIRPNVTLERVPLAYASGKLIPDKFLLSIGVCHIYCECIVGLAWLLDRLHRECPLAYLYTQIGQSIIRLQRLQECSLPIRVCPFPICSSLYSISSQPQDSLTAIKTRLQCHCRFRMSAFKS